MMNWFTCACDVVDEVDGLASYNCSHRNLTTIPACLQTAVRSMYASLYDCHVDYNLAKMLFVAQ